MATKRVLHLLSTHSHTSTPPTHFLKEIQEALTEIMQGHASSAQIGAFLTSLTLVYGWEPAVVLCCADVLRSHSLVCEVDNVCDLVGTGGDSLNTFNVSTASAIVAAGCGLRIAKHGNRASSSSCGSADILEAAGVWLEIGPQSVKYLIDQCNFCFLFSQKFHPAMKHVASIRKELGFRTVFNILGPLTNPTSPSTCLIGVFSPQLGQLMIETLQLQGKKKVMVVCGREGLDEISPQGETDAWFLDENNSIKKMVISPSDFGLSSHPIENVRGGDSLYNLNILHRVLNNEQSPYLDWVLMNCSALLFISGKVKDFKEGVEITRSVISSGKARETLEKYVQLTKELKQSIVH